MKLYCGCATKCQCLNNFTEPRATYNPPGISADETHISFKETRSIGTQTFKTGYSDSVQNRINELKMLYSTRDQNVIRLLRDLEYHLVN